MSIQQFRVGNIPLDPKKINKTFLKDMMKAVDTAELDAGKKAAKQAMKDLIETGEVPREALDGFKTLAKELKKEWRSDKRAIWDIKNSDEKNWDAAAVDARKNDLALNAPFLGLSRIFTNELREATALAAVQGIAGASFGPTNAVAGYAAYANGTTWNGPAERKTTELVETYKQYLSGDSPMTTKGNSVQQVHRAELWKTLTEMTREAAESGENGKPVPITAQYYELTSPELVGNLANAAKAGSELRLNMDVGRLSYPSKDPVTEEQYFEVDDLATKMRTVLQFTSIPDADVGVSIFPSLELLGSATDLMHRKVLRVGDKVLMSGMNGNVSSGENVDAGYVVEGPAAKQFTENVARDIGNSTGATLMEILGEKQLAKFETSDLRMGLTGLSALFDSADGPSEAGTKLSYPKNAEELEAQAKDAGFDLKEVLDVDEDAWDDTLHAMLHEEGAASLSAKGKKMLLGLMKRGVKSTNTKENLKALGDVSIPKGKEVGETTIDIADQPAEREVLTINAIQQAEEFIYLPGFVLTRAVAGAIVARNKEALAEGKPLDIRIMADPGVYPFGGTPNSWGVNFLEEHGIPVRWTKLRRTGSHDRKVHAKQLLTDKGEIAGSTNFSKKGMRENWETSAYVRFDEGDAGGQALKSQSKAQFEDLWQNGSYDLSTADLAAYYTKKAPEFGREHFFESAKAGATRQIITNIENFEVETGNLVGEMLQKTDVAARRDELIAEGYSDGDAALMAIDQVASEEYEKKEAQLPTSMELERLADRVETWRLSQ